MSKKINIACIGDSITEGSFNTAPEVNSYPSQLQRLLGSDYEVANFGISSATLLSNGNFPYIKQSVYGKALAFNPDIILIKLGTNDTKPENWVYKNEFVKDYTSLIYSFQTLSTRPRIILITPAMIFRNDTDNRNRVLTQEMLPFLKEVAVTNGCEYLDLFTPSKSLGNYFPDGVHPDISGTKLLVEIIYNYFVK
jgi:acyl-CoA thioesterase-1